LKNQLLKLKMMINLLYLKSFIITILLYQFLFIYSKIGKRINADDTY
jgi:hypothetical protein